MHIYFKIIPIVRVPGTNTFMCMVFVNIGDKVVCDILLVGTSNWNEQSKQKSNVLTDESHASPKYQRYHYLDGSIIYPNIAGVTTVFACGELPSPNLNGNDERDSDTSNDSVDSNQPPARYPMYTECNQRLHTFNGWPHASPNPCTLSKAGFYYTGQDDLVRCFQCGIGLKDFTSDIDPLQTHSRYSPDCHFLLQLIGEDSLQNILCSSNYMELYKHQRKRRTNGRYRHPEYAEHQTRLTSFTHWPLRVQTPTQLADAGFYYTGFEDQVRCFACDGGLRHWDVGDDPWTEHCRSFPNCPYAIEVKGEEYIALVQATVDSLAEGGDDDDIQSGLDRLTLSDPATQTMLNEHQTSCLQLGYEEVDFQSTVQELRNRGNAKPSLDDILDLIDIIKVNRKQQTTIPSNETAEEKNRRLKSYVYCMNCKKNDINALFLPCGHHKLCMACAQPLECCPVCGRNIREKIKTFMG